MRYPFPSFPPSNILLFPSKSHVFLTFSSLILGFVPLLSLDWCFGSTYGRDQTSQIHLQYGLQDGCRSCHMVSHPSPSTHARIYSSIYVTFFLSSRRWGSTMTIVIWFTSLRSILPWSTHQPSFTPLHTHTLGIPCSTTVITPPSLISYPLSIVHSTSIVLFVNTQL